MARIQREGSAAGSVPRWVLDLPPVEAALVLSIPDQLAALLADPGKNRRVIGRLFPASYADVREEREHREMLGRSLLHERREMIAAIRAALAGGRRDGRGLRLTVDPAGMDLLLRFVNDARLVLATDLGVDRNLADMTVDPASADAPKFTLLVYLGGLESILVEALSPGPSPAPPPGSPPGPEASAGPGPAPGPAPAA